MSPELVKVRGLRALLNDIVFVVKIEAMVILFRIVFLGLLDKRQSPGKVFKGKRMSGHMGDVTRTILSQKIIQIESERHLILSQG